MLGVGYREVNQDQSSDPPALFRTSKAYSSLFSQYTLTAISAVSPHKALYMYVCDSMCVCQEKSFRNQEPPYTHTPTYLRIQSHEFTHTHVCRGWVSLAPSWLRGYLEEVGASGPLLTHAGKWQNITGLLRLTLKDYYVTNTGLQMDSLASPFVTFGPFVTSTKYSHLQACMEGAKNGLCDNI